LVLGVPPHVKFPHKEHPDSNVAALVIAEQDNPPRQYTIRADRILAMHRYLGVAGAETKLVEPSRKAAAGLSRRQLLAGAATILPAAGLASLPAFSASVDDPIFAAIEAHRSAEAAHERAVSEMDDLEEGLPRDVKRQPHVPIMVDITPDIDPNNLPADAKVRWCHDAEEIAATLPAWASAGNREAALEAALAGLEQDRRELEAARQTCGLTAMEAARDRTSNAAEDAALAILDTHPTTVAGVVALLTYAADYTKRGAEWPSDLFDEDEIEHNPRFPKEPGHDWSFYLHRMLAEALPNIVM
jgi:hypothetical protein